MVFKGLFESFLDIVYPTNIRCAVCEGGREETLNLGICADCIKRLPFIKGPRCVKCGKVTSPSIDLCQDCTSIEHHFYRGISVLEYSTEVKSLIYRYKYRGEKYLKRPMIHWMIELLRHNDWDYEIIVPVPLHRARERQRGFNQATLLARGISQELGIPVMEGCLVRVKNTPHQTALKKDERQENLKGAFRVNGPKGNPKIFMDRAILLVDDVYTTGSTVDECAKVLLESGAKRVYIMTLAIGTNF